MAFRASFIVICLRRQVDLSLALKRRPSNLLAVNDSGKSCRSSQAAPSPIIRSLVRNNTMPHAKEGDAPSTQILGKQPDPFSGVVLLVFRLDTPWVLSPPGSYLSPPENG